MERFVLRALRRLPAKYFEVGLKVWAVCSGHRIGTLAANAAFWTVFSIPWLILAIASTLGIVNRILTPSIAEAVEQNIDQVIVELVGREVADQYAIPAFNHIFDEGLQGLGVVGFVVALYAGSRAVRSCVSAIALVSGCGEERRAFHARVSAVGLYLVGVVLFVVALATTTVGTDQVALWTGLGDGLFVVLDRFLLLIASVGFMWTIFHFAMLPRLPWKRQLPAAIAAVLVTVGSVYAVAWYADNVMRTSSFGALSVAPFVAMLISYVVFLMVFSIATLSAVCNGCDILGTECGPRRIYNRLREIDAASRELRTAV